MAREPLSLDESLADYIVREFADLYDARSGERANVERIVGGLERSVIALEQVVRQLEGVLADLPED